MRLSQEQVTSLYELVSSNIHVTFLKCTENDFINYINTIDAINKLDERVKQFDGVSLSEWKVFAPLASMIIPSKVALITAEEGANLLDEAYYKAPSTLVTTKISIDANKKETRQTFPAKVLSFTEFSAITSSLEGAYKSSFSKAKAIDTLRAVVTVSADQAQRALSADHKFVASYEGYPLAFNVQFHKDYFYTIDVSKKLDVYFTKALGSHPSSN